PPPTDRFRLHRAVCAWLAAVAAERPLALVLDDLHRADSETLALLAAVAEEVTDRPLLLIAAYRPDEGDLTAVHARLARRTPLRLPLAGLAQKDAVRLVRSVTGVSAEAAAALAERAAGNPFFLLESARMVADAGAYVPGDVPEGVRDVLRRRFERLQAPALAVLRLLAVAGREADAEVLIRAADADEDTVLDALDAGVEAGLLTEPADGRVRFTHALVRDTLHADLTRLRRARMHTRIAAALRELRPDDVSALAHHYLQAPSADTARPAVEYALRAADLAGRRYAHDTAAGLLARAARCLAEHPAAFPGEDVPARLVDVLGRLLRAQIRGGRVTDARATRARAMDVAEEYDRQDLLIEALTSWTEPTVWENRDYGSPDTRPADALHRLLARDDLPPTTRCRLLDALASALDADGAGAAHDAAAEAVRLARTLGEPVLLAQALATLSRVSEWEFEQSPREQIAAELAELAAAHELPAYGFVAEYVATGSAAFRGDLPAMRRHMERGREIAETHRLSDPAAIVLVQQAALEMAAGRLDEAERLYGEATRRMRANGALHTDGLETIVGFSLLWLRGRAAEGLPLLRAAQKQYGPLVGDALAISLVAAGDEAGAREARAERPPIRRDFFYSLFLAIRAHAALDLRERDEAEELLEQLRPVRHQMIGAGSVALALRPVALTMAELALFLDRPAEARDHYERAVEVARSWESPWWETQARESLARLTDG
ncbi:hypothetical protein G5C51_24455, partial [Streptomyces sp. A7024]|nr:hypothetical protein [Streptomyces coryli]